MPLRSMTLPEATVGSLQYTLTMCANLNRKSIRCKPRRQRIDFFFCSRPGENYFSLKKINHLFSGFSVDNVDNATTQHVMLSTTR